MLTTDLLTVGAVAERSGFATSALRYYERLGLISATRTSGGQRRYQRNVLRRLAFIRAARNVGLSLDEVATALATLPGRPHTDEGRLDPALAGLAASARRADRGAVAAARRARLVHRLRLPVAAPLRVLQPRRRRRRPPAPERRSCPVGSPSPRSAPRG